MGSMVLMAFFPWKQRLGYGPTSGLLISVAPDPFLLFRWENGSCPTIFTWKKILMETHRKKWLIILIRKAHNPAQLQTFWYGSIKETDPVPIPNCVLSIIWWSWGDAPIMIKCKSRVLDSPQSTIQILTNNCIKNSTEKYFKILTTILGYLCFFFIFLHIQDFL